MSSLVSFNFFSFFFSFFFQFLKSFSELENLKIDIPCSSILKILYCSMIRKSKCMNILLNVISLFMTSQKIRTKSMRQCGQFQVHNIFFFKHVCIIISHFCQTFLLPAATELGQGNIFTSVCQEFCPRGEGVCLSACWDTPPWEQTPPTPTPEQTPLEHTPPDQAPPQSRHPPPPSRLQHTVNERPVRILLECILV